MDGREPVVDPDAGPGAWEGRRVGALDVAALEQLAENASVSFPVHISLSRAAAVLGVVNRDTAIISTMVIATAMGDQ